MAPRLLLTKEFSLTIITSTGYGLEEEYFKTLTELEEMLAKRVILT